LFKRNLERSAGDAAELAEQIRVTLYHELGHYLGLDEDALEDLGYG
jgi:predicted Zn-dependent protease with MMP-like domain